MSHPLLAKMHDVLLKIKNAFKETPYKEKTNGIIRTIEMAYVKTANGTFESVESEESNGERLSAKQKRALETATIAEQSTNNATVVSSADGAKVQNNLEILADNYEKRPNKTRGFITDLSKSLGLVQHEASQYGTFETRNGKLVTIRVSNHNARVSFFDENGEENGISIVISSHKNKGMLNDGKAHLVEYFYPKQSIERSESKPLADIVKCVSNALDSGKFDDTTGIAQRQEVNMPNSDENVLYSLRQKPEPEKKGTGYKVFVLGKDGKLYPPMVANPNGAATPVGVWLDADAAPVAGESKTGRPQVKQGGKGTQGGSGKLAYRPGWHLGVIPYAIQFNRKDAEGNKTLFPKNFVFAEVEYAADKDYQDEAHAEGINSNGKYQHSLAGLKHLPTDGYYMYRTNPNPETDPWVITGAMKVNRLLTRAEQADIVRNAGREPRKIQEGDIVTDDVVNSINQEIAAAPKFSLKVYHGSGADFTEFDFDHMGEGAGSQSFGWGGYVTSSKKIGKSYADLNRVRNLPEDIFDTENKKAAASYVQKLITQGYDKESAIQEVRSKYDGFLDNLNHDDTSRKNNGVAILNLKERIATLDEIEEGKLPLPTVSLYEVDIPDDNGSNYLEWEKKPSDEVATKIIEGIYGLDDKTLDDMAARDIVFRTLMYDYIKNADKEQMIPILVKTNGLTRNTVYDNGNVEDDIRFVYNRLSNWMGSPKAASKFLSSLGFTGIKYPAGTIYGGAEEGDVNYVIFKPEDMQIVEHEKFSVKEGINRGYTQRENGDKISKNAYEAEEDGTYSHGTFKRKYKVAARTFPLLQQLGFITNTEWHHTGRNFSKTGFYTWADSDRISGGSISYADGKTQSGSIAAKYKENKQEIDDIVKGLPSKQWEFTKPESTETLSYEAWLSRKIPFREEDYLSKEEQAEKQANHERISADKSTPSYYRGESHKAVDQLYYNVAREHYQKELEDNRQQHEAEYKQYESEFPSKMQKLKEQNLGTNGKEKDLMRIYDLLGYKDSYGQVIKEISRPLATEDIDRVIGDGEKFSVKSKPVRFEIGKKLSDEEKKEVLSTLKDAYKVNGVPYHIEETAGGKEKRVYEPTLDSYVVSDITNRPLRYYITLPDGRVAHPTEVYPNISDNEVKSSATKQGLLDDEADQIVSAAIGNMKGIADNAKAVEVLTELQNLPHETHDIGYGLNNAQSYNYKTGIFTSDAAQAIDYVVRRMRRKEDVPAEIPAALKKAVADSYGMVDNLIDGMSNTKVGATEIKPVGVGAFGNIYNQFRGKAKAAIEFLKKLGSGEAAAALHHHTIGDISLVWGDKKTGLDKILRKHPEVVDNLQSIIDSMEVVQESDNRIKLESPTHFAVVSKEYKGEPREQWLLTAYEKRESLENGKSMDTATSSLGGDTALSQSKESAANIANPSETSKGNAGKFSLRLQDAINETDTEPTEAQKKSGNYKKGHVKFGGYDYTIENPKGSYRSGVDENGKEWKQKMNDTYGYIRGKFGKDGDHLDMFINDKADLDSWNGDVFVVDQVNQDGTFDEHKVMYGYGSLDEAKKAYLSNYEKGWTGLGNITPVSKADFDKWLDKSNRKLKPFADYADITSKTNMDTAPSSFEEFLEHPAVRYSIRNEKERAAAEVPDNLGEDVRKGIENAGLPMYDYDPTKEGDRSRAFNEAINSSDNIRFSLKEEKEKIVSDAKANGTYMTAPNGEKTKLNAEQWVTVRTTNFKNWFGDWKNDPENASKVVDKNGEPMVVWHGRSAEFNTFEKKEGVRFIMGLEDKVKAEGFFFSPNKGLAEEFASNSSRHRGGKANVIPCFLNIRKPMDLTKEDYDRIYEDVTGWDYIVGMDTQDNLWGIMDEEGMADKIKGKGYDGVIFVEEVDDSYEPTKISYCALDANQIKSAENNNGDFSADNNDIRFSLKSMMEKPEGWKQANKKAIHIAEAIERDPKFSLKNLDGTLIKAGTYFSGGGLVEEGLKGIIDPVVAVEYDEKISGVYRNNFGNHIVTADVRDVDPKELVGKIDGEVEYFHASPVCKNYSLAKNNHEELELDKETAASTAEFISKVRPKVVTIENVKGYKDSEAMKTITDALDEAGYKWDADVYNAADYGGYTNRERLIVRAVRDGELPAKPEKQKRKSGWYEAVEDIMPTLTEKKNGVAPWMDERLKADGIDWRHIDKPLYVMGSGYANGTVPHAFADELLPTLRTKSGDVIVMPDGKVYRAMGRVLARVNGVSDDYQMPASEALSHTIIGNGIPTQLTENVIAPLVRDVLHPAVEEKASLKDADRKQTQLDIILKTNPMLDDYHTGIRKVEDIKTLGESVEEARSEAEKYGDDEWSAYPDITNDMLQNALETGEITIYSSKPIKNGVFVTPSYMQASDYAGGGNVYEKTVPLTDVAWINTDEGQYAKVDGERYSLKEVNDKFNDRLAQLIENPNQKDRVLHLGRSSQFLIDGGIADAEIELDFDKFVRKSSEKYKNNHPFSAGDIKDLPKAIAHPVAVFNSTTKKDHVVMTELNHDGKNFIVAIRATEQNRKNKVVLEVNQITSLYPKGERGIIYWINNNGSADFSGW